MSTRIFLVSLLCLAFIGCSTPGEYAAQRRQQLLAGYPPGTTTRAMVHQRWAPTQPDVSETRPTAGWTASAQPWVGERAVKSEQRTGSAVYRCEQYFGPDGWSGGLCYCWFFYDDQDRLVDAEWQWHTD